MAGVKREKSEGCFDKGNVRAGEPGVDARIKHMINKINGSSPLLVTPRCVQGQWTWKQEGRQDHWGFRWAGLEAANCLITGCDRELVCATENLTEMLYFFS